jgi:hypothetical protein
VQAVPQTTLVVVGTDEIPVVPDRRFPHSQRRHVSAELTGQAGKFGKNIYTN